MEDFLKNLNSVIAIFKKINGTKPTTLILGPDAYNEAQYLTHTHNTEDKDGLALIKEIFDLKIEESNNKNLTFWIV